MSIDFTVIFLFIYLFFLSALVSFLLSLPFIIRFRKIASWEKWELIVFLLPQLVWEKLFFVNGTGKSLTNLGESLPVIILIPTAIGIRALLVKGFNNRKLSVSLLIVLSIIAVLCYLLTPGLSESGIEIPNYGYNTFIMVLIVIALILDIFIWIKVKTN